MLWSLALGVVAGAADTLMNGKKKGMKHAMFSGALGAAAVVASVVIPPSPQNLNGEVGNSVAKDLLLPAGAGLLVAAGVGAAVALR